MNLPLCTQIGRIAPPTIAAPWPADRRSFKADVSWAARPEATIHRVLHCSRTTGQLSEGVGRWKSAEGRGQRLSDCHSSLTFAFYGCPMLVTAG